MHENRTTQDLPIWRLPLLLVVAAAVVSMVVGAREIGPAYEAEFLVRCGHQAGSLNRERVEQLLGDQLDRSRNLAELTIDVEQARQGAMVRIAYTGDMAEGYVAARDAARGLVAKLDCGPLTQARRADLLYGIELQLVELAKPLKDQPLAEVHAKRADLLSEKERLQAIDLEYQWEAASMQQVRSAQQPWQSTIAAGAPALLLLVSTVAAVRLFQRQPDPPATDEQTSAALLRIPSRTVTVSIRKAA